jgi:hypothetical protein
MSVCLSIYLSVCLSVYLSVCLSVYLSIYLSVSVYLSIYLSIHLSVCMSVCLSIYLSIYLYVSLSIYLYVCLSVYLSIYLSACLFMALQPFVGPCLLLQFLNLHTVGKTPWTGDQPIAKPLPAHTGQHKHRINAHRHYASSGTRTYDASVRASEDCSCLRRRGHCCRPVVWQRAVSGCTCPSNCE